MTKRRSICQNCVIFSCSHRFKNAKIRLHPIDSIPGFSEAGDSNILAFLLDSGQSPVIHSIKNIIFNDRDISRKPAFPGFVKFQCDSFPSRLMETKFSSFKFIDQIIIDKQFSPICDVYYFIWLGIK